MRTLSARPSRALRLVGLVLLLARPAPAAAAPGEVEATIEEWRRAWEAKDLARYLGFYAPDFRADDLDLAAWRARKHPAFAAPGAIAVALAEVEVELRGDLARARFVQSYRSGLRTDRGYKTLLMRRAHGRWQITEEWWVPEEIWPGPAEAASSASADLAAIADVEVALEAWRATWAGQEVEPYLDAYAPGYSPAAGPAVGWREARRARFAQPGPWDVVLTDIVVETRGDRARTDAHQSFRSPAQADEGTKTLFWRRRGGRFRIVDERWTADTWLAPEIHGR